jgi:hypothetical protein
LPQPLSYHAFADQRTLLGIPHCLNVVSNVPFLVIGVFGLRFVLRRDTVGPGRTFLTPAERAPWLLFFLGVGLTAFGSAWYHLDPTNDRLTWDRLPMALAFMAILDAVLGERVGVEVGRRLLPFLVAVGLGSVLWWDVSERLGRGDLRPYLFVAFYPLFALPLLLLLFPPRYTGTVGLLAGVAWYALAKVFEHALDHPLYDRGHLVSGHTLKHLAAACATWTLLRMLQTRRPVKS